MNQFFDFLQFYKLWVIIIFSMVALFLYFYLRIRSERKKIEQALIEADLADKKEIIKDGKTKIIKFAEFKIKKDQIVIKKFNKGKSTHDFLQKKQLLSEIFDRDIIEIVRDHWKIRISTADWSKLIVSDPKNIVLGFDGKTKILKLDEDNSMFVFGLSGAGKTSVILSFIKQAKRLFKNLELTVFTPKPQDFWFSDNLYTEDEIDFLYQRILKIETERSEAERSKVKLEKKHIIVLDEVHILNFRKDLCESINKLILLGRNQGIEIWLLSQKGGISEYKNLHISQTKIKISVRNTESLAFAETVFTPEIAKETYFTPLSQGFGYIKTPSISGSKVKFFYE